MKKILSLFLIFAALTTVAQTVNIPISNDIQTKDGKQFYIHTVQRGQTVYSISKAYHVGIKELYYYNPAARNGIQVGQKLWIPTENKETVVNREVKQKSFDFFYHVAAAGETINHVASIYVVPKKYILLANPGLKGPLKEGEYIKIPVEDAYKTLDAMAAEKSAPSFTSNTTRHISTTPKRQEKKISFTPPVTSKPVYQRHMQQTPNTTNTSTAAEPDVPFIKNYQHVVIGGETMQSIAKKYDITVAQLKSVNPGLVMIIRGQRLRLPTNAKVPGYHPTKSAVKIEQPPILDQQVKTRKQKQQQPQPQKKVQDTSKGKFIRHIVTRGETLYSISKKYGVNLTTLYRVNKKLTTNLSVGQVILIPKKKINKPYVLYSPTSKTRLKKVARMYQIDYDSLQKENPMLGRKVFPGQVVRVPAQSFEFENTPVSPGKQVVENKEPVREQQMEEESTPKTCNPIPHTETFKVALMVPLYLSNVDSLEKTKFMLHDQKHFAPFTFIHFLQGGLLAADLMKKQGMKLQLYVYDVDQQLTKTAEVLSRPELKNMDLIIGPFYSRSFDQVSMFAAHFGIPIVNPLTFRKEVLSQDEGVIKVKPGYEYLPTLLKRYIAGQDRYDKVFIIHQDYNDQAVVNRLTDTIAKVLPPTISFSDSTIAQLGVAVTQREKEKARQDLLDKMKADPNHEIYPADTTLNPVTTTINDTLQPFLLENNMVFPDSLKYYATDSTTLNNRLINIRFATDSLHPFEDNASVLRKNLVIVYSKNKPFVMDVMNRLNVIRDTFHVKMIGLPDWENYTEMDYHQMNNLNLTYPASHYVNLTAPETKDLDSLFAKHFGSMPEVYGNLGFDITYYFLNALYYHGHQMTTCLPFYPYKGISTEFHFKPAQKQGNYENSYWNLLQIKDMKLHSIPDSLFEKHPSPLVPENYDQ